MNKRDEDKHLLLRKARTYPCFSRETAPEGCRYDMAIGAWLVGETTTLLVDAEWLNAPRTKKADVETGEDQKGE